jgi:hypothetical protein
MRLQPSKERTQQLHRELKGILGPHGVLLAAIRAMSSHGAIPPHRLPVLLEDYFAVVVTDEAIAAAVDGLGSALGLDELKQALKRLGVGY